MPDFFIFAIIAVIAFGTVLLLIAFLAVRGGKLKLKKGGAPGIDGGSRGSDSSMNL